MSEEFLGSNYILKHLSGSRVVSVVFRRDKRGSREADGEWACASWPVRSCPESRESRREVSVSRSWLSLCGCLKLRLRTKGHCCSQGHLFHGLLLVSGSESLPTCALTRGPGSLNCHQSWAPVLSFVASLEPACTLQLD